MVVSTVGFWGSGVEYPLGFGQEVVAGIGIGPAWIIEAWDVSSQLGGSAEMRRHAFLSSRSKWVRAFIVYAKSPNVS